MQGIIVHLLRSKCSGANARSPSHWEIGLIGVLALWWTISLTFIIYFSNKTEEGKHETLTLEEQIVM
jgi:cytochrome b